jgi:hypothetical protein
MRFNQKKEEECLVMIMRLTGLAFVVVLLAACEERLNGDEGNGGGEVAAEGKAEEGTVSIKAPGVDISVKVPKGLREKARFQDDGNILPPGARPSGVHVEAGESHQDGSREGAVEVRFTADAPPAELAAWYRDPARGPDIDIGSVNEEGAGFIVAGTTRNKKDPFTIRLTPRQGGGTEGRLTLRGRG